MNKSEMHPNDWGQNLAHNFAVSNTSRFKFLSQCLNLALLTSVLLIPVYILIIDTGISIREGRTDLLKQF